MLRRDNQRPEEKLELLRQPVVVPPPAGPSAEQRKRMLMALAVLLIALAAIVLRDWDFWFPPRTDVQEEPYTASASKKEGESGRTSSRAVHARRSAKPTESAPAPEQPMSVKAERTALPPLSVEVVAGNRHMRLSARDSAINVDLAAGSATPAAPVAAPTSGVVSAADRVQLSEQATQRVSKSVAPDYPMLARQMKVQGAVVLQALISREGTIQELQVLSGPTILAAAAREAVRQWRFRPYYQSGEAVETQAKITVNFTISTN
jgi:TonB family protein